MLNTPNVNRLITDIAEAFNEQMRYIPSAPVESQSAYEAAIKDTIVGVATAIHKNVSSFDVDLFYRNARYPGTHPIH